MKRFVCFLMCFIIPLSCLTCRVKSLETEYSVPCNQVNYTYDDLETLNGLIAEQIARMDAAHQIAENARALGYGEQHSIITLARTEWTASNMQRMEYVRVRDNLQKRWQQKEEEYPIASYIWSYLKGLGYSNQVCAGILGNMMTEAGGNTLDIQPTIYTPDRVYYGICQWSKTYFSEIHGATLDEQLDYLAGNIKSQINTFGSYEHFISIDDPKEAATYFAKKYERGSGTTARANNAVVVYNYFVS